MFRCLFWFGIQVMIWIMMVYAVLLVLGPLVMIFTRGGRRILGKYVPAIGQAFGMLWTQFLALILNEGPTETYLRDLGKRMADRDLDDSFTDNPYRKGYLEDHASRYAYIKPFAKVENSNCVYCKLDYEDSDMIADLPCKHTCHSKCLDELVTLNNGYKKCPVCKRWWC